jgi:hypothetical protein
MASRQPKARGFVVLRRFLAVIGGFVASGVSGTVLGVAKGRFLDPIIGSTPPMQPMSGPSFVADLALYAAIGATGGWAAALIAPSRPVRHAMVLSVLFLILGINDQRHPLPATLRLQTATDSVVGIVCCLAVAAAVERRRDTNVSPT